MTTLTESAKRVLDEYVDPAVEALGDNIRDMRQVAETARHEVEDRAAAARWQVRRHPLVALGVALGVGTVLGCAAGFALAHRRAHRPSA